MVDEPPNITSFGRNLSTETEWTRKLIPHLTDWLFKWLLARHEDVSDLAALTFGRSFYE